MLDKKKNRIFVRQRVIFAIDNNPIIGKVVGFTKQKVKVEREHDKYVNLVLPYKIMLIEESINAK